MLLASLVLVLLPLSLNGIDRQCVNFPEEECPPQDGCIILSYIKHNDSLLCCHFETPFLLQEALGEKIKEINEIKPGVNITALHIRNVSFYSLDVSALNNFPLQFVSITDNSVLRNLSGQFNQFQSGPGCLNFSTNNLDILDVNILKNIDKLQFLDLSQNNLTSLPHLPDTNDTLHLDISGNKNVLCNEVKAIMMAENKPHFERQDNTYCSSSQTFHWFNSTERIPLLEKVCPQGHDYKCKCETVRLFIVPGKPPAYSVQVDCSGQRLTALPELLPNNTVHLNISNNNRDGQSADLAQVGGGEQACESPQAPVGGLGNGKQTAIVAAHTGCYGLESFAVVRPSPRVFILSILSKSHSFTVVTMYPVALNTRSLNRVHSYHSKFYKTPPSNARYIIAVLAVLSTLKKLTFVTRPGKYVRLSATGIERIKSGYVSSLTPLVSNLAYKEVRVFIADNNYISSILNLEGSDFIKTFNVLSLRKNNLKTVIDLDKNLVCMTQRVWTDYIYYIIAGQVALLLLLVSKVSYDYWVFKTTGYLPWPASKMPKMPCDWLFES
uniref:(California timema) hypothetical protein n=1 Tax=Timema californicum TaxID=61474 RepID=A0A7R9JAM5_TIMCA|nr:unnamed protein product [Timema californicum]